MTEHTNAHYGGYIGISHQIPRKTPKELTTVTFETAFALLAQTEAAQATWTPEDYNLLKGAEELSEEEAAMFDLLA